MSHRNVEIAKRQRQERIPQCARASSAFEFFNVLTGPEMLKLTESHLPEHRERLYPPTVTRSMFISQTLNPASSCQRAVDAWGVSRVAKSLKPQSLRTTGYCRAPARLPLSMVQSLTKASERALSTRASQAWRWRGRTVKLLYGTDVAMPDTAENQARFPQQSCQAPGVGFPLLRLCELIDLSTDALLEVVTGPHRGAYHSELDLSRTLLEAFSPGALLLAETLYANHFLGARLINAGVDVVLEQHGSRRTDFRRIIRLDVQDHLVHRPKPRCRPDWMSFEQYATSPEHLAMREAQVDGCLMVTTLRDTAAVPKARRLALYRKRWSAELDFACLTTTLGLDVLWCRAPAIIERELRVYLLAYNLIRLLMAQAAVNSGQVPRQLSFKHTVQLWNAWTSRALCRNTNADVSLLFHLIAQARIGYRRLRCEPKARKRPPKSFPWMKVHRDIPRGQNPDHPTWRRVK